MKKLYLVTGASGKLGEAFVNSLTSSKNEVYALARRPKETSANMFLQADLLEEKEVEKMVEQLNLDAYKAVTLIHTVGRFKFELEDIDIIDNDGDGIDDEVYATNVVTTKNILKFLLPKIRDDQVLNICVFASVSDKYDIPFWRSYTRAKNVLRNYLQTLSLQQRISALVVNVSTVDTGNENLLRPKADKTYWLRPQDVAERTLEELSSLNGWKEIDIINENPDFKEDYYIDHDALLEKWHREMGS